MDDQQMKQLDVREMRTPLAQLSVMMAFFPAVILRNWQ
jgi:hypothetical protein